MMTEEQMRYSRLEQVIRFLKRRRTLMQRTTGKSDSINCVPSIDAYSEAIETLEDICELLQKPDNSVDLGYEDMNPAEKKIR